MKVDRLVVGPFQVNTYIIYLEDRDDAVVVDPGADSAGILKRLSQIERSVSDILITHGHADHIMAASAIKNAFPGAHLRIHARDAHMLTDPRANLSMAFGYEATAPPADAFLEGGTEVKAAGVTFSVEHVPGHSPGSVCLVPNGLPAIVFSGDTLFAGTIGRTDFPGGNMGLLVAEIREKILTLPDDTVVYPGHGEITTVGIEKRDNYFVVRPDSDF